MVLPANQGIQTQQSIDRATKGQGKIVHAQKEDILKTHAAGPCEGVTQGVDRQVAMEHPLEVPRVGERVISYTRRDIAKDAILEPGLVSSQHGKDGTHLPLAMPPPRRRLSFTEAPRVRAFSRFEGSVKLEMVIGCVFRVGRRSRRLAWKEVEDLSFPDRIDSAAMAAS